ncbi:ABC transporter ATP-binding protein [Shimia aestuarii]|uniref:Putative ABC transport system ATP-binding protein n=1 Tax=Shimia aestuarii TaxID=254406 RepID=A0A1I4KEA1_9RHOB|nr:ABC transporter ATP-binding protein [Shimia aestuarii]SFL77115.1 putative ABC transport system ATP-binding protein [Shimia aestuarii]
MNALTIDSLQFRWPNNTKPVLDLASFALAPGESVLLKGPSGIGKSTLLSAIAGVINIPANAVSVAGTDVGTLSGSARDRFRVDHLGLVFQVFNLLPWLNTLDNVLLPCRFSKRRRDRAGHDPQETARALLTDLGLGDPALMSAPASTLSVGQQQRVAAARALIGAPELILADEPTSALDEATKHQFVELLMRECAQAKAALLFVSHDTGLEQHFDRVVDFRDLNRGASA